MIIIDKILGWLKKIELETIEQLRRENELKEHNIELLTQSNSLLRNTVKNNEKEVILLNSQLMEKYNETELESYWNNKISKANLSWRARPLPGQEGKVINNLDCDLRIFCTKDNTLPSYHTGSNDDKALLCYSYIVRNIMYKAESGEFWQFPFETFKLKTGDCEDQSILMSDMMLMSGIPYWRIRLNKGEVLLPNGKKGYHVWLTYLKESDNQWYTLDTTFYPKETKNFGLKWKDSEKYFTPDASWNEKYCFIKLNK